MQQGQSGESLSLVGQAGVRGLVEWVIPSAILLFSVLCGRTVGGHPILSASSPRVLLSGSPRVGR